MSDDLIRRSDAIEKVADYFDLIGYDRRFAKSILNNVPSADRPQGEWIVDMPNYKSICSLCGANEAHFIYGTEMWYGLGKSRFCPSCGRRMKGAKGADDE